MMIEVQYSILRFNDSDKKLGVKICSSRIIEAWKHG